MATYNNVKKIKIGDDIYNLYDSGNTTYSAGSGLSLSGTTINHSNSVTAGTASEGGSSRTLAFGGTFNIPSVSYDSQGHITSKGSITLTMPANPGGGSGTVTSVDTGVGLTGGTITSSGTIKAKLKSETKATYSSNSITNTSGKQYAVVEDKDGYLSVNVPWDAGSSYSTITAATIRTGTSTTGNLVSASVINQTLKPIKVTFSSVSGTGSTVTKSSSNSNITTAYELIHYYLSNPAAQVGDLTVTTSSGSVSLSGKINGTTDIVLYLGLIAV